MSVEEYSKTREVEVIRLPPHTIYRSRSHDWLQCTPDALQYLNGTLAGLECKMTMQSLDEGPLPHHVWQCRHSMMVTGLDTWTLVYLPIKANVIQEVCWTDVHRDMDIEAEMFEREQEFWKFVTSEEPPPADETEECAKALGKVYRQKDEDIVQLPGDAAGWDEMRMLSKEVCAKSQATVTECENQLKQAIGTHAGGRLADGTIYTWKADKNGKRTLRRKGSSDG